MHQLLAEYSYTEWWSLDNGNIFKEEPKLHIIFNLDETSDSAFWDFKFIFEIVILMRHRNNLWRRVHDVYSVYCFLILIF